MVNFQITDSPVNSLVGGPPAPPPYDEGVPKINGAAAALLLVYAVDGATDAAGVTDAALAAAVKAKP